MKFSDIPGHTDVKDRLRRLVDTDRIPHALLLEGTAGTGKFALARALAQYIHCQHRTPDGDSCGVCPACQQHQTFNHIDTIFTFPVVKKGSTGLSDDFIADFRDFLTDSPFMDFEDWLSRLDNINAQPLIYVEEANNLMQRLSFTAHGSRYKVVLLWLPERLKEDAANKLLKLVEEPHADTLFIMVSDNSRQILPTIYSRTQRITVKRYDDDTIAEYLQTKYPVDGATAAELARLAEGNMVVALRQLSLSKESETYLKLFIELMRKAYQRRVADLKKWAADLSDLGRERQMQFWMYASRLLRENFFLNMRDPALICLNADEMAFCRNFSPFVNERNVLALFDVFADARKDIAANGNAKLINFDVAIKSFSYLRTNPLNITPLNLACNDYRHR